ncbi:MAG: OmpA family protein [Bacteroidales bacterium]|nr:OmpA family protein [Bacteroidales bacterium]HPE86074.1 OmpA family protein [Bacteroidales bacterium]
MKKIYLLSLVLMTMFFSVNAQTTSYPWVIGTGVNFVDFIAPQLTFGKQLTETTWEGAEQGYPFGFYVSRYLAQGFALSMDFNTVYVPKQNIDKYVGESSYLTRLWNDGTWGRESTYKSGLNIGEGRMFYGNLNLQYNFFSSMHEKRLKNETRKFVDVFDPYIIVGIGMTSMYETDAKAHNYLSQQTGIGFNFWFQKNVSVYAEGAYEFMPKRDDYLAFKFGLKVRFGKDKDIDKDGIPNAKDECPEEAGPKENNGCPPIPDSDGDGLTDDVDKCPDEPGLPEFQGCNDRDGDGVADYEDSCPDMKGPKEFNGCPDRDGDGVSDFEDSCPDQAGPKEFKGCPDSDGDGIPDPDDKCPDIAGLPEFDGCPDRDGDGISDLVDSCPDEAGLAEFNGCPDTDGDGIPDKSDNCPEIAGIPEEKGCPKEVVEEIEKQLSFNAQNIYFESGKSIIRPISYPNLDNILEILNDFPNIRLRIEGHTDNTGGRDLNLSLSEDRAFAVRNYFTERSIDPSRFVVNGYGPDRPVATNETSDGRAKNRRTEIHLIKD